MAAPPRRRRHAAERGLAGYLIAGLTFVATVACGLCVVDWVREFAAADAAAIRAAGDA